MRIGEDLAVALIADRFPQWAHLPVRQVLPGGWDNRTFRLGSDLVIRLPSAEGYAAAIEKEQRWLPSLAPWLPLPIPAPVAAGGPAAGFPWPWSVNRWLGGESAGVAPIDDEIAFARDLAAFLRALRAADVRTARPPARTASSAEGTSPSTGRRRGRRSRAWRTGRSPRGRLGCSIARCRRAGPGPGCGCTATSPSAICSSETALITLDDPATPRTLARLREELL